MYGLGGERDGPGATQRGRYLVMEESIAGCSVAMKLPSESKWPETTTATPSTICSSRPPS